MPLRRPGIGQDKPQQLIGPRAGGHISANYSRFNLAPCRLQSRVAEDQGLNTRFEDGLQPCAPLVRPPLGKYVTICIWYPKVANCRRRTEGVSALSKRKKSKSSNSIFKFRRHDRIGSSDAQEDREILRKCFVDTGDLEVLADTRRPECIVLGRTGVGKTALLSMLEDREEKVTTLDPHDLALNFLSNRPLLNFFIDIGVDLDLFFRVLWRHIVAIEIIKLASEAVGDQGIKSFFQSIQEKVYRNRARRIAQDYLRRYPEFWKDTQVLITEETKTLEKQVDSQVRIGLSGTIRGIVLGQAEYRRGDLNSISEEERREVAQIGQDVVNKMQMRELTAVIDLLANELIRDRQKKYFIAIDKLDENWTSNPIRYKLIRALFETTRDFNGRIPQVKVVCAIREDLLDRVFRFTRAQGDQQEKYRSLYLQLHWKPKELVDVLDLRVHQMIAHRYAKNQRVRIADILPKKVRQINTVTYIIERTLNTPRDVIVLFNECIKQADGKPKLTQTHILAAEGIYSELRLKSLADEWSGDFSTLTDAVYILKQLHKSFRIEKLDRNSIEDRLLEYLVKVQQNGTSDHLYRLVDEKMDFDSAIPELLHILYRVGIVGVKKESYLETYWSHKGDKIHQSDINSDARFHIHPAFYRILGVNP